MFPFSVEKILSFEFILLLNLDFFLYIKRMFLSYHAKKFGNGSTFSRGNVNTAMLCMTEE